MGTVWEAYDEFLHRTVSVKEVLLPPGVPESEAAELRERTMREARAIAALSHPNVIMLHDVAREGGEPFVVTEYVLAHSLATLVHVLGPLSAPTVAAIGDAVAAGLAAAHQAGITHRDVKPGNVLIGVDGQIKLTDFGISRNVSEQTLTRTGIMLGSPAYIAPEVAAGREVTPAADLWGLGATLFAIAEGRPPYDADGTPLDTVNQVVHGDVPKASADGPLGEVIAALMVKEPTERITLREVRDRLHPLLPPATTPLLSEEDLARLNEATAPAPVEEPEVDDEDPDDIDVEESEEVEPAALAPAPGAVPTPGSLAPAPGPLPFDKNARATVRHTRGGLATTVVIVVSVLMFCVAATAGFALSRRIGGEPLLPPARTKAPATSQVVVEEPGALRTVQGDAATVKGEQGGGFTVPVPGNWVKFVEEIGDEELANSTRVNYVSPDGTLVLTVERFTKLYPNHTIADYLDRLRDRQPEVTGDEPREISALPGGTASEPAVELKYRTTADAKALAPNEPAALNQNRVTFADLWPLGADLWVVSITAPIDQEDSGGKLFDKITPDFEVTG